MKRQVFISYRRDDDAGDAGRLYDRLREHFHVWFDLKSVKLAEDFTTAIDHAVSRCDALVVVIGRHWTGGGEAGRPMNEDPNDFVRIEVASALERGIPVFPVLVDGATMPPAAELPPSLAALSTRHALELSRSRFDYDVGLLVAAIDQVPRRRRQVPSWARVAVPVTAAVVVLTGAALAVSAIMGPSPTTTLVVTTTVPAQPVATSGTVATSTTARATTSSTSTTVLVTVPNVVGTTAAEARNVLERLGLTVVQRTVANSARAGVVVSTSPAAGTRVAKGATVTINVSTGLTITTR